MMPAAIVATSMAFSDCVGAVITRCWLVALEQALEPVQALVQLVLVQLVMVPSLESYRGTATRADSRQ